MANQMQEDAHTDSKVLLEEMLAKQAAHDRRWWRHEFAKAAMQGLLSTETYCTYDENDIAELAVFQADKLLAKLEETQGG